MTDKTTVLVIDDEPGIREMLSFELSQEGFEVETAESGMAAVAAVKRRKFDLAVTDLKMPGMDGSATVEALRAIDPDIEVIVATGYASVDTAVACMKRGAYDYINKPYDLVELKHLLERALQKSHLQGVVALYEASRALLATLKQSDLVTMVVKTAQQVLRAEDLGLLLWRGDAGGCEVHGLNPAEPPEPKLLRELAERVRASGEAMCISNADTMLAASKYSSVLVYPLMARGRTLGALAVFRHLLSPGFASSELQKGTIFANQLALSLDNARLYENLGEKITELVSTREQLVQIEKLALAGQLASSVAHEVNNPLSFIGPNLEVLVDYSSKIEELWGAAKSAATYLRQQPNAASQAIATRISAVNGDAEGTEELVRDVGQVIDDALAGVKRIGELVSGFTRLGEPQTAAKLETIDVAEVMKETLSDIEGWGARHGVMELEGTGPFLAMVARKDLSNAVRNLLNFTCAQERVRAGAEVAPSVLLGMQGGCPFVQILDENLVMSEEDKRRVFDPRVEIDTSKARTMRLNLGLALSYQMLRRNGAEIVTDFKRQRGLLVRIVLKGVALG
jgi:CheY-like chemotaxis protein/signal transduction histidine kinase